MTLSKLCKAASLVTVIVVAAQLTGCMTVEETNNNYDDAAKFSTVVSADPNFMPYKGEPIAWQLDLVVTDANAEIKISDEQKVWIQGEFERQLTAAGFVFTEKDQAEYVLGAAVLLDHSDRSENIQAFTKVFPDLHSLHNEYETGTLILAFGVPGDHENRKLLWRGAIQAYQMGDKLSQEERKYRLQTFIAQLVQSIKIR